MKTSVTLQENMHFIAEINGHEIHLDAAEAVGGQNLGVRPKHMTLNSLAGCTAMDVISILRKMRIEPDFFAVEAQAEQTEEHPKVFSKIKLIYRFKGQNLPLDKLEKAISLSQERYCGVSAMLRLAAPIETEILVE